MKKNFLVFFFSKVAAKNGFLPLKGKVILLLIHFISTMTSFASSLLFFAPSLGLFDLMWHWRLGSLQASIANTAYDIMKHEQDGSYYPVFFREVWQPIEQGGMMPLSFHHCVLAFLMLATLHILLVYQIKAHMSMQFGSATWTRRIHHNLPNMVTVLPFSEWDDIRINNGDFSSCEEESLQHLRQCKDGNTRETSYLLLLKLVGNIVLCSPLWMLWFNISQRNAYLDGMFPPLPEEELSTLICTVLSIAAPIMWMVSFFLQIFLLKLYNTFGHPWSRLYNLI